MRLLLTHGFFLGEDPKEQQILRPYPPLGILYISAYLRSRGFDVDVYDSTWGTRDCALASFALQSLSWTRASISRNSARSFRDTPCCRG